MNNQGTSKTQGGDWWQDEEGNRWPGFLEPLVNSPGLRKLLRERVDQIRAGEQNLVAHALEGEHRVSPITTHVRLKEVFLQMAAPDFDFSMARELMRISIAHEATVASPAPRKRPATVEAKANLWKLVPPAIPAYVDASNAETDIRIEKEIEAAGIPKTVDENRQRLRSILHIRKRVQE